MSAHETLATVTGESGSKVVLTVDKCKFDDDLIVDPAVSSWKLGVRSQSEDTVSAFPYLKAFINLACIAYEDHKGAPITPSRKPKDENSIDGDVSKRCLKIFKINDAFKKLDESNLLNCFKLCQIKSVQKELKEEEKEEIVEELSQLGFEFLAEARNNSNGYRGVVYVNEIKRQVILSHRGTEMTNLGAVWIDVKNIWWGAYTSHLSSAITFAHHVAQFALQNNCQLFFTGHSLGAWLAQITCFSTKYLTTNESGHFVRKSPDKWDEVHPYTVAFDSPGALEFLRRMQDDLTLGQHPLTQKNVNVACLPVEVFQFLPNSVNKVNTQVGSVYLVNVEKAQPGLNYSYVLFGNIQKPVVKSPHKKDPVRRFVAANGTDSSEESLLESQVYHWKLGKDWSRKLLDKWWNEGRSVEVNLNKFAEYFLTAGEVEELKKQKEKKMGGCYEGLSSEDERIANLVVEFSRKDSVFAEGCVQLGEEFDRREVIPLVRHFVATLRNEVIWWNPRKPPIPLNFIRRRVARTMDEELFQSGDVDESDRTHTLDEVTERERLVLLVDAPGMGKSSEMTHLEHKLRVGVTRDRIILRVNLNEVQITLKNLRSDESASSVLLKLAHPLFLPPASLETPDVAVFVLLDGLDEVCPKHKTKMIDLLRILTSPTTNEKSRVVVTTRPHLRSSVEAAFGVESWSLLPLAHSQQDAYIQSVSELSGEVLRELRRSVTPSVEDLLRNPLMLSMFVDVLNSRKNFSWSELNIFELYTRYVETKHRLQLVEKEGMGADNNFTQMRLEGMFGRVLPHYHRAAVIQLIEVYEEDESELNVTECGGCGVAEEEPSGVTRDELLSLGLLVEGRSEEGRLVFKHRSFAEFFYARLLTREESAPQLVRDVLFGNIYNAAIELENVEAFVAGAAAASLRNVEINGGRYDSPPLNHNHTPFVFLTLTTQWLRNHEGFVGRCNLLNRLVSRGKLWPLLAKEVLLSFVRGDPRDLWESFRALLDKETKESFSEFWRWMSENGEWTRRVMLQMGDDVMKVTTPPATAAALGWLMVAIGMKDKDHVVLTEEEVGVAVNSCDKLIFIVSQVEMEGGSGGWAWAEERLSPRRIRLKELFLQMDAEDVSAVFGNLDAAWKMASLLSQEQICEILTNEETRVSDVIGENPRLVGVVLGEEFVPRGKYLAEFRGKFGKKNKGKTVFEMEGGRGFGVETVWGDLVEEVKRGDLGGRVGVALREALGRMREVSWLLLEWLEVEVQRRRRFCRRLFQEGREEASHEGLLRWVSRDLRWNLSSTPPLLWGGLPTLLCYCDIFDSTSLAQYLGENKRHLNTSAGVKPVLRSVVLLSSLTDPRCFSVLLHFLRDNFTQINPEWQSLVGVFLGATREDINAAPVHLVRDVCVGGVTLNLLTRTQQQPTPNFNQKTWESILRDVIATAPCCDLPAILQQLRQQMKDEQEEVLTSERVLEEWVRRLSSKKRNNKEEHIAGGMCGVNNFLSFYFSLYGQDNLDWMKLRGGVEVGADGWTVVGGLPVEIADALRGNAHWADLLPTFQGMLREHLRMVESGNERGWRISYETEAEWEGLLSLIEEETLLHGVVKFVGSSTPVAAPFIRTLIKLCGVEWTSIRLTAEVWAKIPSTVEYTWSDTSVGSLGSLLQSAVELGELEEVKRRGWPGLVVWRNEGGKTALQVATEMYGESHPIRVHFRTLTCDTHKFHQGHLS